MMQVNRQFIAANIDINEEVGDNVASELIRYEFAEILVRIVKIKWIDCNKMKSYYEGLGKLFERIYAEYPILPYAKWRKTQFWNQDISNLMDINKEQLKRVFDHISHKYHQKRITLEEMQEWMCTKVSEECRISKIECQQAFAISKMPVFDEEKNIDRYNQMSFVEFIEFIGRLAELKFKG